MRLAFWLLLAAALFAGAAQLTTLKRLGVTAATVIANRDGTGEPVQQQFAPMLATGLRWYVENIAMHRLV